MPKIKTRWLCVRSFCPYGRRVPPNQEGNEEQKHVSGKSSKVEMHKAFLLFVFLYTMHKAFLLFLNSFTRLELRLWNAWWMSACSQHITIYNTTHFHTFLIICLLILILIIRSDANISFLLLWQGKSACGKTASMDQGSIATSPQGCEFGGNNDATCE